MSDCEGLLSRKRKVKNLSILSCPFGQSYTLWKIKSLTRLACSWMREARRPYCTSYLSINMKALDRRQEVRGLDMRQGYACMKLINVHAKRPLVWNKWPNVQRHKIQKIWCGPCTFKFFCLNFIILPKGTHN